MFSVAFDGEQIAVTDRLRGISWKLEVRWKPKHVSCNGLGLALFGGYVKVRSMSYDGAAAAGGAPGQTTLDELGSYLPLPAQGSLLVTRNGAWCYALE